MEKRYFTASGSIVWVCLSVGTVPDDDGSPFYFVSQIEDVTERVREQEALRDLAEMLSHDLRTPTTVIAGLAQLLSEDASLSDGERRGFAERIGSTATSMTLFLEAALTAVTMETGQLQPS